MSAAARIPDINPWRWSLCLCDVGCNDDCSLEAGRLRAYWGSMSIQWAPLSMHWASSKYLIYISRRSSIATHRCIVNNITIFGQTPFEVLNVGSAVSLVTVAQARASFGLFLTLSLAFLELTAVCFSDYSDWNDTYYTIWIISFRNLWWLNVDCL